MTCGSNIEHRRADLDNGMAMLQGFLGYASK